MGWKKKLDKARKLHRPSVRDWERDDLYDSFPSYASSLSEPSEQYKTFSLRSSVLKQGVERSCAVKEDPFSPTSVTRPGAAAAAVVPAIPAVLDAKTTTKDDFASRYEARCVPCVIQNIPFGYDGASKRSQEWPAIRKWTPEALSDDPFLRDRYFKCGEDDDGRSVKVKLRHFLSYLARNRDDSPLYVFDSGYEDDRVAKSILSDYVVPSYFNDDLFGLISEARRPPYRWFLVGPERSGTTVHIDPLGTSAWNTLIYGRKRWVLFPPHVPKHIVKGRGLVREDEDDEAVHYFMFILPRIKRKAASLKHSDDYRDFACYEFTQQPGETVFIPTGWWHAVLNLTHTVGVTQNFCSPRNFDDVWVKTRIGRKKMAWKWLCQLDQHHPRLAQRARELNERDKFVMKYDPEVMKKQEERDRRRKLQRTV